VSRFRRWLDYVIEGGWLLAVVLITLYFNIYTKDSRIFEPQKALVLRTLVTFMLAAWAVRTLDENRENLQTARWWRNACIAIAVVSAIVAIGLFVVGVQTWQDPLTGMVGATLVGEGTLIFWMLTGAVGTFLIVFATGLAVVGAGYTMRHSWKDALRTAMVIPALAYVAVHIVSTIASVFPQASLYGGYVRQQGTLTVLAYIGLFFVLAFNLRQRGQLNRLITVILLTSVPAALYGVVQKAGIDPLPWMGNVESRVASTMGNAIFIAAYLIMILPLTGYRLLDAWKEVLHSPDPDKTPPARSRILGPIYPGVLWGGIGVILAGTFIYQPISILVQISISQQQTGATPVSASQLWGDYTHGLLLFAATALLTVALPALIYTLITLTGERRRPYAYLAGLATAAVGAAALLLVPATQTNTLAWGGYLGGLCALALVSRMLHLHRPWGQDALWADAMYILIALQSLFLFAVIQQYLPTSPYPTKWWVYLVALFGFLASCYIPLAARIGGRVGHLAKVGGYLVLAGLQLACIILTQSRGPLAGLLAMLFVFAVILAWRRGMRWILYAVVVFFVVVGIFLAIFNLPNTPVLGNIVMSSPQGAAFVEKIQPLKNIPYFGRLGRMFDAESGTGRVRILIWFGDEIGTGSVGMITHNPLRLLIGYGPETMHVAYNPYYPPELAHVEKRNASPDRAHDALIDELVTLGALGLAGYFFYFASFFVLAWQLLRRAPDAESQTFSVALFSLGVAHFVETLFGIPIVSTRMYMWMAIGIAVALTFLPPFFRETVSAAEEEAPAQGPGAARRRRRADRVRTGSGIPTLWKAAFALIFVGASLLVYRVDIKPMVADILFWQSKQLQAQADAYRTQAAKITDQTVSSQVLATADKYDQESMSSLHQAIELQPLEDFYYLSLAQIYLDQSHATTDAQTQGTYYLSTEQAISRARDLSPLNTDHYRNLSALYISWFSTNRQPELLIRSIAYGEQAISLTGNNADLRNRLAQAYLTAAVSPAAIQQAVLPKVQEWLDSWEQYHLTSGGRVGDTHLPIVAQYRQQAQEFLAAGQAQRSLMVLAAAELQYSLFLDEKFSDTYQLLGDLYRQLNMPAETAVTYATGIRVKPALISDSQLSQRLTFLSGAKQLAPLAQAYEDVISETQVTVARTDIAKTQAYQDQMTRQIADTSQTLGYVYILLGDDPAAIGSYERAVAIRPTFEAYKNLAILYDRTAAYDKAKLYAQKALETAQNSNLADEIKQLQGLLQLIDLEIQVQSNPGDYQAHYQLAGLYTQLRRSSEALAQAKLAAQYVPADNKADVYNVNLRLGDYARQSSEYDVAEQAYKRALQVTPKDLNSLYGLALVYEAQGRKADALTYAQQALQVAPADKQAEIQALVSRLGTP
jgi:tetratricopeptide (TPR) repeat protein